MAQGVKVWTEAVDYEFGGGRLFHAKKEWAAADLLACVV